MNILPGSKIVGASGKCLVVDRLEGDVLVCGDRRIKLSAVAKVESPPISQPLVTALPPPEPDGIQIGDRLRRNAQPQTKYPKAWFVGEEDDRPGTVPSIESATVERFSIEGYWVRTPDDRLFHVPESALEEGTWELIDSKSP